MIIYDIKPPRKIRKPVVLATPKSNFNIFHKTFAITLIISLVGILSLFPPSKVFADTPPLTNLAARYVAGTGITSDGASPDRISLWADQSGNGYNLSQATSAKQPYNTTDLNGNAIVRFPYDYPTHPQVSMANASISLNTQSSSIFVIRSTYHSAHETLVTYTSWASIIKSNITATVGFPYLQTVGRNHTSIHPPLNKTLTGGVLGSSGYIGYSINASSTQSSIASVGITGVTIGSNAAGTDELFTGDIYEILIYNTAVNQATVDAIRAYAVAQYGVQSTFTKKVVMVGDSNTEGSHINNGENYPRLAYPADWQALNNGIGGTHLSSGWLGQANATTTDILYDSSLSRNVMVVMLGTNDINSGGKSAAETFANMNTFVGDRQAAGWEVWVMTIPPLFGGNETVRDAYNVLLVNSSNYTNPPDKIIDYTSDPRIGNSPALGGTDYGLGDNLHFNDTGAAVLSQYVYKELNGGTGKISYSASGNSSGQPNESVTLTLTPSGGTFLGETITPSDGGAGGTFTPSTMVTTIGGTSTTTTYSRPTDGTSSITFTNNGVLNNPSAFNFTATSPTYTIGGTTSGLTGTVVLQNNAGDNESVSTGSFTFDTAISDGATYTVTVLTQPTGQTCTVSSGSGTIAGANVTDVSVSCSTDDSAPPVRSAGSPSGSQSTGTTQVTLSLTTDENSTCKYSASAGTAYGSMSDTFSTTGGTSHSTTISGLSNGNSYNYYARCTDGSNANTDDYTISFSVASPPSPGGGGGGSPAMWTLPTVPTSGFKLNINGGAPITPNRNVTLGFNAGTDIKKIAISMTGDFTDASQEDYTSSKQWDLCSKFGGAIKNLTCPDGKYTIYAKFYTVYGRSSNNAVASSTITLKFDTTENLQVNLSFSNPFTKYLQYRQINEDVKRLQIFLNTDPDTRLANSGIGSPGRETNYFGILTYRAVIKFQEKYASDILSPWKLIKGTGYVGKTTLAKINELISKVLGQ